MSAATIADIPLLPGSADDVELSGLEWWMEKVGSPLSHKRAHSGETSSSMATAALGGVYRLSVSVGRVSWGTPAAPHSFAHTAPPASAANPALASPQLGRVGSWKYTEWAQDGSSAETGILWCAPAPVFRREPGM